MTQEKSLTIPNGGALATHKDIPGLEEFPESAVVIPRMIIGQPNNLSGYPEGTFVNNLSGETFKELDAVLLKFQRSRVLWPQGKPKIGDEPDCRSGDAKIVDVEFMGRLCQRCNGEHHYCEEDGKLSCKHAKFTTASRPECRLAYHLLLVSTVNADVFILTLTGKNISPTNKLISNFKVKGRAPYSARFKAVLEKAKDGEYYIIKYQDFKWLESPGELQSLFDAFKKTSITPTREETATIKE